MKRLAALLVAVALGLTMQVSAFAAAPQKIKALDERFAELLYLFELDGKQLTDGPTDIVAYAGSELRVYLVGDEGEALFYDQYGSPIPAADISPSRLRAAQVSVKALSGDSASAAVLRSVDFAYGGVSSTVPSPAPYISVKFAPELFSVQEVAFQITLQISVGASARERAEIELSGNMGTTQKVISSAGAIVDISDGSVALARRNLSGVTFDLGAGVTVTADLTAGERYYGIARLEMEDGGDSSGSAAATKIYSLQTINLDGPTSRVRIETDVTMYVYNGAGAYLNTTRAGLPYSEEYYLTNRRTAFYMP